MIVVSVNKSDLKSFVFFNVSPCPHLYSCFVFSQTS